MNELESRIVIIKQKIDQAIVLSELPKKPIRPFGSKGSFKFNSPLDIKEVIDIENQYEIKLPAEYRAFITTIANGGAGPAYGLASLERSLEFSVPIDNNQVCYDFLKTPFVHTSAYNPYEDSYLNESSDKCDRQEISESEFDSIYDSIYKYSTAGTIIICHEGCGYYHRLVITGPTRGQIWLDGDCSDQGYFPLKVNFLDWYEKWLDDILIGKSGTWWIKS